MKHLKEYTKWETDSTGDPGDKFDYEYISKDKIYYGIHPIKFQYEDGNIVTANAKFDTGAATSSISFDLGKKLGIPDDVFKAATELEEVKIDKSISKDELHKKIKEFSDLYKMKLDFIKSASGTTLRVMFPLIIYFNGKEVATQANLINRKGLKADALVGLKDML